ncbi:MFS transporter [Protaetiibacter mangrovi]|uniref:MFS transporter n=1 Tax=Protaetiibacter mangrovi TaxID=2970926 RepID=A0ABT1ZIC7_9MICO|nr:MFS transporter [Protaetiibacter mangrovi]MCS0500438.1 MFS transporter [Protaetiibacter mangrovi]TPW96059.1 MFS transporter [Schumannella luteola]
MVVRRAVYVLLFPLAFLLPLWVLIGRGILLDGIGWDFIGYLIVCPILFVMLLIIGGLVVWRPGVRQERAVSGWDAALLVVLWLVLIAAGFVAHPAIVAAAVVLVLAAFWFAVWELVTEGRRRLQAVMDDVDATVNGSRASVPQRPQPVDIGEVIVVTSHDVTDEKD